jgi:hypothetical protein
MRYALKLFADGNGRTWKSKLSQEWETGGYGLDDDIRQPLMLIRNVVGPSGLAKIKTRLLDDVRKPLTLEERKAIRDKQDGRWQANEPEAAAQGD